MSISTDAARRLFEQMSAEGIPLTLSVPFLIRVRGWRVQYFCRDIGIHRGYFNALLHGLNTAPLSIRMACRKNLGLDPWQPGATGSGEGVGNTEGRAESGSAFAFSEIA
jgi:hypothetical protein